ncbi:MAG: substrate-binding domain-containing protein [Dehalococcoidia bacterium]
MLTSRCSQRSLRFRALASVAIALLAALLVGATACSGSGKDEIILACGTTIQDSGLLDVLEPMFEKESGYTLKSICVGTGQALEMGSRGDADVLWTHDPKAEEAFVAAGDGVNRRLVMHNDFIIVGPQDDPAGIGEATDAVGALEAIAASGTPFISRGDDSGTHKLEMRLWQEAGIDPVGQDWYEETGQGMGATLQVANQRDAYTISDRGTYLSQRDRLDLTVDFEGDPALINIYHVMQVNPDRHDVNAEGAAAFVEFLTSASVQKTIGEFGVPAFGEPLFTPDAGKSEDEIVP